MDSATSVTALVPPLGLPTGQDGFCPQSVETLTERGLTTTDALAWGLKPITSPDQLPVELQQNPYATTGSGILFPWPDAVTGETVWQFRPDEPRRNDDGDTVKYVFGRHVRPPLALIKSGTDPAGTLLIVEGSFQSRMAAAYAAPEVTVLAISGCWNFGTDRIPYEIPLAEGRPVVICLDADASSNHQVYAAGIRLGQACEQDGATSILFTRLAAGGSAGLDDVMAAREPGRRAGFLARLIAQAKPKPADRAPKATKAKTRAAEQYLNPDGGLLVRTLAEDVLAQAPALLTAEHGVIAFYRDGFYQVDRDALAARMAGALGDHHRSGLVESVRQMMVYLLTESGRRAPELSPKPLVCVPNGMLDLTTGELLEHSPDYLATHGLAVPYDPNMATPVYDAWVRFLGIEDQIQDLEEVVSQMLDPSVRPTRTIFLFGPKRSGKSTYLRLMRAVAGPSMTSAVSLHDMATDVYASANLYGKILNSAGELSSDEVADVTTFKKATGEDEIHANRKYGHQFDFTSRALMAFSANEVPPINDPTGAATYRIKPFHFARTYAGREDPKIEQALMTELPGILARWRVAWKRRTDRGSFLETKPEIRVKFLNDADQVRTWTTEFLTVHPTTELTVPADQFGQIRELYQAYRRWAEDGGRKPVGERRFGATLRQGVDGVREVRRATDRAMGVNVTLAGHQAGQGGHRKLASVSVVNP